MNNPDTIESLQALSPDELRVRVAELMGLKVVDVPLIPNQVDRRAYFTPQAAQALYKVYPRGATVKGVPPFHTSLDSCREFEDAMTDEERRRYASNLGGLLNCGALIYRTGPSSHAEEMAFTLIHATPLQKCQAYILTKAATTKGAE